MPSKKGFWHYYGKEVQRNLGPDKLLFLTAWSKSIFKTAMSQSLPSMVETDYFPIMCVVSMWLQTYPCCHLALVCQHMSRASFGWGLPSHSDQFPSCLAGRVYTSWFLWCGFWPISSSLGDTHKCNATHPKIAIVHFS